MRFTFSRIRAALLIASLSLGAAACATNPATGERQLILVSRNQEIEMGQQGAEAVRQQIGLYQNQSLQEYVGRVGQELAARSENPNLPWSFQIVDDPVVNAFALPGGFIFITRGILGYLNSEAEMAAVIGHEIGHVTARHSAEQISRAQAAQLGLGLGSIFVPEIAQFGNVIGASLSLLFLKFGRDDERQADELGLRYMSAASYDPHEMVDVFTMLGRVSEASGGSSLPTWLSTHPAPEDRRQRIEGMINSMPQSQAQGQVDRDRYLQAIDGIVFGNNPRNGFFRGSTFLHPELEFTFEFPEGWQTQNLSQMVAGMSGNQDAIIQLTLAEGNSPDAAAQQFFSQQGVRTGNTFSDAVNGLPARWGYFGATTQDGQELRGLATFIAYGGHVFQILGYTVASRMSAYDRLFQSTLSSFDRLTDPSALNVQPKRIEIVELNRSMSLQTFAQNYPSTVDLQTLAVINGVDEGATLAAGRKMKRVVGGREEGTAGK